MAKLCVASLLLFAVLHEGLATRCYESNCLTDLNLNSCVNSNRTVLKECNSAGLRNDVSKLQTAGISPPINMNPSSWACVKYEVSGTLNGQATKGELKMCFPDSPDACKQVMAAAKDLDMRVGTHVTQACSQCTGDSCNPAQRPSASSLGALAVAAGLLLLRR